MKRNSKIFPVCILSSIVLFFLIAICFNFNTTYKASDSQDARIGNTYYSTIKEAFNAVKAGETIILNKDVTLADSTYLLFDRKIAITFDLNGHNLIGNPPDNNPFIGSGVIVVRYAGSQIMFTDSSSTKTGRIYGNRDYGTYDKSSGVLIYEGGEGIFSGGTYEGTNSGVYILTNGAATDSKATVYDGNFKGHKWHGMEVNGNGVLYIYGGNFTSEKSSALKLRGADSVVYGGSFNGYANGCRIESDSNLEVYGGTFIGNNGNQAIDVTSGCNVTVYSGNFSDKSELEKYLADGNTQLQQTPDGLWQVITSSYKVSFQTNGGKINSGEISEYIYGVETTLPTDVTKDGYHFVGWFEDSSLTGDFSTKISSTDSGNKV